MKDVTFYMATRNRADRLERVLDNLAFYCPHSSIFVGNCSSPDQLSETSDVLKKYSMAQEFLYEKDPGTADVYSDLFEKSETEFSAVWADDVIFLRSPDGLCDYFLDSDVELVALPMVDDISLAPSIPAAWPKDEFGCAFWMTPTGRCAHHSIVRSDHFRQFGRVYTPELFVDNFLHKFSSKESRRWPSGAYILHTRIDDDTRLNTVLSGNNFRFDVGHPSRGGSAIQKASDRR